MAFILKDSKKILKTAYSFAFISYKEIYPNRIQSVEDGEKFSSMSISKVGQSFCRFSRNPHLLC